MVVIEMYEYMLSRMYVKTLFLNKKKNKKITKFFTIPEAVTNNVFNKSLICFATFNHNQKLTSMRKLVVISSIRVGHFFIFIFISINSIIIEVYVIQYHSDKSVHGAKYKPSVFNTIIHYI